MDDIQSKQIVTSCIKSGNLDEWKFFTRILSENPGYTEPVTIYCRASFATDSFPACNSASEGKFTIIKYRTSYKHN